jgi:hypothetical protein|tara:strand:+ start:1132 stop:1434 length:303 start_codon:yes stop_codon:yes gene_type:complete
MIYDAVKDMRDTRIQSKAELRQGRKMAHRSRAMERLSATVWLGSTAARMWFDHVDMNQRSALQIVGWAGHAKELLAGKMRPEKRRVLEIGIDALQPGGTK